MKAKSLTVASFVLALAAALILAFAPLDETRSGYESLVSDQGTRILAVLAVPVAIASLPVLISHRGARIAAAVLLWSSCVLAILSIGIFFVPAAVLMTVAAAMRDSRPAFAPG